MSYSIEIHIISNRPDLDKFIQMWNDVIIDDDTNAIIKVLTLDYPEEKFTLKNGIKVEYIKQMTFPKTRFMNQAWARNELLYHANCDYVLFFDDWQRPDRNILLEHLRFLRQGIICVGTRLECDKDGNNCKEDARNRDKMTRPCHYGEFWTCNVSVKLSDAININGFDNRYNGGTSGEDYDFGMRISRLGIQMMYNINSISYHHCHYHLVSRLDICTGKSGRDSNHRHIHNVGAYKYLPEYKHMGNWNLMQSDEYELWWEGPIKYFKCKRCGEIGILDSAQVYYYNRDNNVIRVENGLEQIRKELDSLKTNRKVVHDIFLNKSISGVINERDGLFLYDIAKECKEEVIVEIGSTVGLSTTCLALGSKDGSSVKVYSIDPHIPDSYTPDEQWLKNCSVNDDGIPDEKYYAKKNTGNFEFYDNIKKFKVDDIIVPIVDYSEPAYKTGLNGKEWNLPISLLFIDGDNRYNYIKKDIELFGKWVINGGKILMHDKPFPGPTKVINQMIVNNPRYYNIRDYDVDPIYNFTVRS